MGDDAGIQVPAVDDSDIAWVCELLGLPATAFSGVDGKPLINHSESRLRQ